MEVELAVCGCGPCAETALTIGCLQLSLRLWG